MSDTPRNEKPALRKTPLYDRHVALGARIVDFGGWAMPVQYSSILDEHRAVRGAVGLFDVCHMGEVRFTGPGALAAVERLVTNDVRKLVDGQARYTTVLYENGGIVDDCIVYRESEGSILIVINAANTEKDIAWFRASLAGRSDVEFTDLSAQTGLIAVQGPRAAALLDKLAPGDGFSALKSFHFKDGTVAGVRVWAARTGYTGEDGFELFCPWDDTPRVWDALLEAGRELGVKPCGLGARDTLRLEAAMRLERSDQHHEALDVRLVSSKDGKPNLALTISFGRYRLRGDVTAGPSGVRIDAMKAEIDGGVRPGTTTSEAERIAQLERENRELRRANTILKQASAFFAAELDRPQR